MPRQSARTAVTPLQASTMPCPARRAARRRRRAGGGHARHLAAAVGARKGLRAPRRGDVARRAQSRRRVVRSARRSAEQAVERGALGGEGLRGPSPARARRSRRSSPPPSGRQDVGLGLVAVEARRRGGRSAAAASAARKAARGHASSRGAPPAKTPPRRSTSASCICRWRPVAREGVGAGQRLVHLDAEAGGVREADVAVLDPDRAADQARRGTGSRWSRR